MNEMKPEDVMRAFENGRYVDADKLWNNRPKMPNANAYGTYHDGFFDCMSKFSAIIRKAIDEECVSKDALALLCEKDAEIERLQESLKLYHKYNSAIRHARAEAVTEFAERLKQCTECMGECTVDNPLAETYSVVREEYIDQIAKEMIKENGQM